MTDWIPPFVHVGEEVLFRGKRIKVKAIDYVLDPDPYWQEINPGSKVAQVTFEDGVKVCSFIDIKDPSPKKGRRAKR